VGCAVAVATIAPWVVFNLGRFDTRVYLSTGYGQTLAAANCAATYSGRKIGYKDYDCIRARDRAAGTAHMDTAEKDKALRKETMKYIRAHLGRVPIVVAARIGRITELYRPRDEVNVDRIFTERERWVAELALFTYYAVAALAVAGGVALRRRGVTLLPLIMFPVIVVIAVAITFAQLRYRAPAEAALVLLAAAAIDAWRRNGAARRRPVASGARSELISV
jgi:hypothetical protein